MRRIEELRFDSPIVGCCLGRSPPLGWSELAQSCGFYDQAHLVHDCRTFAGLAPTSLRETLSPDGIATVEG